MHCIRNEPSTFPSLNVKLCACDSNFHPLLLRILVFRGTFSLKLVFHFQPTIGFDIFVPESGLYILLVKYLHPEKFIQRVFVTVGFERGMLEILPCKYQFACRQFAMDDRRRARAFEMKRKPEVNVVKLESSGSAKLAVVSHLTHLRYNSDQRQISLCNINTFSVSEVMRIKDMINKHEFRWQIKKFSMPLLQAYDTTRTANWQCDVGNLRIKKQ